MADLSNEEVLELVDCITVQVRGFTESVNRMIESIEGTVGQLKQLNEVLRRDEMEAVVEGSSSHVVDPVVISE